MASVLDVAKFIVDKLGSVTTMKLQKLVFYAQAWSLAWDEKPLFNEDFQAWANGPVCPELFQMHKGKFEVDKEMFANIPDYSFTTDEIETIMAVLDAYGDKEPHWLSELTHQEDPWRRARGTTQIGMPCSNIITKESMQDYYGGLQSGEE